MHVLKSDANACDGQTQLSYYIMIGHPHVLHMTKR